ncbi:nitroreductase [Clostridium acetobutylicum]|nr:nitroreductase [Clostridium acetobutylicum]
MDLIGAIDVRHSRRKYTSDLIDSNKVIHLENLIEKINKKANLHLQLILNDGKAFENIRKSYGMFSGVQNYIALVGKNDKLLREKVGYYGEKIVLEATTMNLGTCWVGGSFDKEACSAAIEENEILLGVITVGNVSKNFSIKEKLIFKAIHRKSKKVEEMCETKGEVPEWFKDGMMAVKKAPSAINKQPVRFRFENSTVTAAVKDDNEDEQIDLGIAKLHFEIGAKGGKWQWGNGAKFTKEV